MFFGTIVLYFTKNMDPGKNICINRLSVDELAYELAIRGVESGTCDQMRKQLASLRRLEKIGGSFTYPEHPFTHEEDRDAIRRKLTEEIQPALQEMSEDPNAVLKLRTKFFHLIGRADRMKADDIEQRSVKSKILGEILSLLADLDDRVAGGSGDRQDLNVPPSLSLLENLQLSRASQERGEAEQTNVEFNLPRHSSLDPAVGQPQRSIPVSKWNITFSGGKKDMSVNAFLERIEELRIARNVSKETLFDSGVDLFAGKALHWYRYARKTERTWDGLVKRLREEFQPNNYAERLFEEIKGRTQSQDETVGIYVAIMSAMFDRLDCQVSEETKLRIILRNLAPFYQTQLGLVEVKSLEQLKLLCKRLEERRDAAESYIPPVSRKQVLEPDLACIESAVVTQGSPPLQGAASSANTLLQERSSALRCYNCNEPGHKAIGCLQPKKLRCYKCNLEGYTKKSCPRCSTSGNGGRRH